MEQNAQLTLFLWLEGLFPRTAAYYLLQKELADSAAQMYEGRTNDPRLKIQVVSLTGAGFETSDPNDHKPADKSLPCLRIVDGADENNITWIHESSSILRYLEEIYTQDPPMMSSNTLDRAVMQDCLALTYEAFIHSVYYIKNAASVTGFWSGIRNEDRSLPIALHSKQAMMKSLKKLQDWAARSLQTSDWLTPGTKGPGLVDVSLAAGIRYIELSYSFKPLEDEMLAPLRGWYARFKSLPWWEEFEERGRHPKELAYPPSCCEV